MTTARTDIQLRLTLVDRASQGMRSFGKTLQDNARDMRQMGLAATALGGAIVGLGAIGVKTFASFEQTMARVQAVSNATTAEFADLTTVAREMGRTTVFTANESAEALSFMAMAGLSAENSIGALPSVLQLAAAGALELGTAADIITNVMAGMGLEIEDLGRANDVLVTAFTSTNTTLEQLGEAFKFAGPVARAAGLSFEDTSAALALMGNAGIQATMAGTALRGAIGRLLAPTSAAEEVLGRLGVNVLDASGNMLPFVNIIRQFESVGLNAADALEIFGLRAGPGMLALVSQGSDALEDLRTKMLTSGGTAKRIADVQLATLQGQFTLLKSAIEGTALEIGAALMPMLLNLIDAIVPVVGGITEFIERNNTLVLILGGVGVALVAAGVAMVGVGFLIPALVSGFALVKVAAIAMWTSISLPAVLAVAAAAGVIAAFFIFRDKLPAIFEFVGNAFEFFVNEVILFQINNLIRGVNLLIGVFTDKAIPLLKIEVSGAFRSAGEAVEGFGDSVARQLGRIIDQLDGTARRAKIAGVALRVLDDPLAAIATSGAAGALDKVNAALAEFERLSKGAKDEFVALQRGFLDVTAFDVRMRNATLLVDEFGEAFEEMVEEATVDLTDTLSPAVQGMIDLFGQLGVERRWVELLEGGFITIEQAAALARQRIDEVSEAITSMPSLTPVFPVGTTPQTAAGQLVDFLGRENLGRLTNEELDRLLGRDRGGAVPSISVMLDGEVVASNLGSQVQNQ